MADQFSGYSAGLSGPAANFAAVVPSDSTDLPNTCRSLYVGTGGSVAVQPAGGGAAVTFTNVPNGSVLPVRASRVMATGTTASGIVALW